MKKVYKYENSIVIVENCDSYDLKSIKQATERMFRQLIKENQNGNCNSSRNLTKE